MLLKLSTSVLVHQRLFSEEQQRRQEPEELPGLEEQEHLQ